MPYALASEATVEDVAEPVEVAVEKTARVGAAARHRKQRERKRCYRSGTTICPVVIR